MVKGLRRINAFLSFFIKQLEWCVTWGSPDDLMKALVAQLVDDSFYKGHTCTYFMVKKGRPYHCSNF